MRIIQALNIKHKIRWLAVVFTMLSAGSWIGLVAAAGSASFSLSPASGSHDINTTFSVSIYENSGSETVNTVDAHLSYDQAKLEYISLSTGGSPFGTCTETSGGGGSVRITCAKLGGTVTGNQFVGSVSFKALVGLGSTSVNFASDSHIVRSPDSVDIWNGNTTGGTYSFTTPAAPPSGGSGSTAGSGGGSAASKPKNTTTTAPASTTTQQANPAAPVPTSTNTASKPTYFVAIRVVNQKDQTVTGASVKLGDQTVKSDSSGIANFPNVQSGTYDIQATSNQGSTKLKITVDPKTGPNTVLQFEARLKPKTNLLPYILLPALALLVAVGLWLVRKRTGRFPWASANANKHFPEASLGIVTDVTKSNTKPPTINSIEHELDSPYVIHPKEPEDTPSSSAK